MSDDFHRYIEHLQGKTLANGFEDIYDLAQLKDWIHKHEPALREAVADQGFSDEGSLIRQFEQIVLDFEPTTRFELPYTKAIFEPLLEKVRSAATRLGLNPVRPVQIATSTDANISPLARPSSGPHVLFIGLGTSSFCNYWAKAYAAIMYAVAKLDPKKRIACPADLKAAISKNPSGIVLATRLTLYYAVHGTLMEFGRVRPMPNSLRQRFQLLEAMELFALSHEFAHFLAEERLPQFRGMLDKSRSMELELFCDQMGLALTRECSDESDNFLTFAGVGAILLFRATQLCELARELLIRKDKYAQFENQHPPFDERIKAIKAHIAKTTPDDQRDDTIKFIDEFDLIATSLNGFILQAFEEAVTQHGMSN
jgi:hypothetical protein